MVNIRKYRGLAGITQEELSQKVNLSRQFICFLESDECKKMTNETAEKISSVLNCEVIDLYGLDNLVIEPKNEKQAINLIKLIFSSYIKDEESKNQLIETLKGEL